MQDKPEPKFRQYERVIVESDPWGKTELLGEQGTVLWPDLVKARWEQNGPREWRWVYVVCLESRKRCPTLREECLASTGEFDPEEAHLGEGYEISFDTILEDDFTISEGSFRLPRTFWQVFEVRKDDVTEMRYRIGSCRSGVGRVDIRVPRSVILNELGVMHAMGVALGVADWDVVRGPDSMYFGYLP